MWECSVPLQGLWHVSRSQAKASSCGNRPSNTPCCGLAWNVVACVELHASLPWRGKPLRAGSKRTSRTCLMSKNPFCLRHRMTFSNWMKSGVLYAKKITNDGCGRRCAGERAKSWGSPLASESLATCRRVWESIPDDYTHCHTFSDFWHATNTCSRLKPIIVLGRKLGRLRIGNGGTTPCVNEWAATFDKHCPFPNLMSIMTWLPSGLLFSILWAYHLPSNHYPQLHCQQTRLPHYGPEVQQALLLAWKAANQVCAKRLIPFLPHPR